MNTPIRVAIHSSRLLPFLHYLLIALLALWLLVRLIALPNILTLIAEESGWWVGVLNALMYVVLFICITSVAQYRIWGYWISIAVGLLEININQPLLTIGLLAAFSALPAYILLSVSRRARPAATPPATATQPPANKSA
jgi:hypothetical protein